jgi:cytidylate kinase
MVNSPFIIAIDGMSASGKGTLAKLLAEHFNCAYLPTGNLYRLVAKNVIKKHINLNDTEQLTQLAHIININELNDPTLASEQIADIASKIAVNKSLREVLNNFQREWVKKQKIAIIEGRDIGTFICPDANIKFFMTADLEARANRRYNELKNKSKDIAFEKIYEELKARDQRDSSRTISPLVKAEDAFSIDSTNLTIAEVFKKALTIIENKLTI